MGAIAGILSRNNKPILEPLIKMLRTLAHRGNEYHKLCIGNEIRFLKKLDELDTTGMNGKAGIVVSFLEKDRNAVGVLNSAKRSIAVDGEIYDGTERKKTACQKTPLNVRVFDELMDTNNEKGEIKELAKKIINDSDGGFSIAILNNENFLLARDVIGIKPLFTVENYKYFAFASEKKALWDIGLLDSIKPVLPGEVKIISRENTESHIFIERLEKLKIPRKKIVIKDCIEKFDELLCAAIEKRIKNTEAAVLFSGGLDSAIIAYILKKFEIDAHLFCASFKDGKDYNNSKKAARILELPLTIIELTDEKIIGELKNIVYHLETNDTVTAEIACPFYFATKVARAHGFSSIFSGQGADELFGGYSRYETILRENGYDVLHNALYDDLINIWHKNILRDDMISMANGVELKMPYLDNEFVEFCLQIPTEFKLTREKKGYVRKHILRELGKRLNMDTELITQPKLAVQYGSGASKCFRRLSNKLGLEKELLRANGFNSANEVLMNLICFELGFPRDEVKNVERLREIISEREVLSKV